MSLSQMEHHPVRGMGTSSCILVRDTLFYLEVQLWIQYLHCQWTPFEPVHEISNNLTSVDSDEPL